MATLRVIARPRIHIGLVDLSGASLRAYCGLGFAVNGRPTIWRLTDSLETSIEGIDRLDDEAEHDLRELWMRLAPLCSDGGYRAILEGVAYQHVGLGTKTTLCLSLIAALNALKNLSLSRSEMIALSRRGGASGVGVNLFFDGGIIWDGGHPHFKGHKFLPSGAQCPSGEPPLLARWTFPDVWKIVLLLPKGRRPNGEYERDFFQRIAPLPKIEALETMAIMYHGVIPAIATRDTSLLRDALCELHKVGFKSKELMAQSDAAKEALSYLQKNTLLPVGMSSMGPLIYIIVMKGDRSANDFLRKTCQLRDLEFIDSFDGWNSGPQIVMQ